MRVQFAQTIASADYIQHLYDLFKDVVGTPPRVYNIRWGGTRDYPSIRFKTFRHNVVPTGPIDLKFYYDLFYPLQRDPEGGRKKLVPKNIGQLLTARALAYWFMDDGTCKSYKSKNRTYRFSTHSFPFEDQEILIQALRDNF